MDEKVPVILHFADYRGDHAADCRRVVMVSPHTTVNQMREMLARHSHGVPHFEVGQVVEAAPDA